MQFDDPPPGPPRTLSIVVLAVGIALIGLGFLAAFRSVEPLLSAPTLETPGSGILDLDEGSYVVYSIRREGTLGPLIEEEAIDISDARTGATIRTVTSEIVRTLAAEDQVFVSSTEFVLNSEKAIAINVEDAPTGTLLITSNSASNFTGAGLAVLAATLGFIAAIGGTTMLIVGHRGRSAYAADQKVASHFALAADVETMIDQ